MAKTGLLVLLLIVFYSYLEKAIEIEEYLQTKLNISQEGQTYSYSDFCQPYCETSDVVNIFLNMYRAVEIRLVFFSE